MAEMERKAGVTSFDEARLASTLDARITRTRDEIRVAEELRAVIVRPLSPPLMDTTPIEVPDPRRHEPPRDCHERKEGAMSDEQAAPETRGVTVELLATVDLGGEIEGMEGRAAPDAHGDHRAGRRLRPAARPQGQTGDRLRAAGNDHRPSRRGRTRTTDRAWAGPRIGTPIHWLENRGTGTGGGDLGRYRQARVTLHRG